MGRKADGDFGMKCQIRALLAGSGISYNDLEPKYAGNDSLKSMVETLMYRNKISVEELKEGTFYINLENGVDDHHIINDNNKDREVDDDDDIINNDKMMMMEMEKMKKMKMKMMKMKMKMLKMKRKMLKMKMMKKKKDTYDYNTEDKKEMDGFLDGNDSLLAPPPQISMLLKSPKRIENKNRNMQLSNAWT